MSSGAWQNHPWVGRLKAKLGQRSSRWKSFVAFVGTSFAARGVTIGCQFLQVPLVIKGVGAEGFGYWTTLTSINYMMNFADLGMGMGLQNKLAVAFATDRKAEGQGLFGSTFAALSLVGLSVALLLSVASTFVDFSGLFHLQEAAVQADARAAAILSIAVLCAGFPLGLAQRLAYSTQLGWQHNAAQALAAVISLLGIGLATYWRLHFLAFFAAGLFPPLLLNALLLLRLSSFCGWRRWRWEHFRLQEARQVLSLGAHFSLHQVLNTVLYAVPPVVISAVLGASAVTPFNLVQRLFNLFGVAQNGFMNGLWPIYSEAHARGETQWLRRTLWKSCLLTVFVSLVPMTVGALLARPIIALWVGPTMELPGYALIWLLFAWNALQFLQQPFWFFLAGVSEIRRLTPLSVLTAIVCACSMAALVKPFGAEGVVTGLLLGYAPFLVIGAAVQVFRYLQSLPAAPPVAPEASSAIV